MAILASGRRSHNHRERCYTRISGESRTVQSHKDSSDINFIVNRYQRTGEMPKNPRGIEGQYMDCTPFQGDITENYNNAVETSERIQTEMREAREQALEDAKRPVDRNPESDSPSPTDQPKGDQEPAVDAPKGAHSSE